MLLSGRLPGPIDIKTTCSLCCDIFEVTSKGLSCLACSQFASSLTRSPPSLCSLADKSYKTSLASNRRWGWANYIARCRAKFKCVSDWRVDASWLRPARNVPVTHFSYILHDVAMKERPSALLAMCAHAYDFFVSSKVKGQWKSTKLINVDTWNCYAEFGSPKCKVLVEDM